jgi:hypothetical protein
MRLQALLLALPPRQVTTRKDHFTRDISLTGIFHPVLLTPIQYVDKPLMVLLLCPFLSRVDPFCVSVKLCFRTKDEWAVKLTFSS